jgi:hypothetical protein
MRFALAAGTRHTFAVQVEMRALIFLSCRHAVLI